MSFENAVHTSLNNVRADEFPEVEAFYFSEKDTLAATENCFLLFIAGPEQYPDVGGYGGTAIVQEIDIRIALRMKDLTSQEVKVQCKSIKGRLIAAITKNRRFDNFLVTSAKLTDGTGGYVAIKGNGYRFEGLSIEGKFWSEL